MNPKLWWGVRHVRYEIHNRLFRHKWGHFTDYICAGGLSRVEVDGKIILSDEYLADLDKVDDIQQGRR